MLRRCRPRSVVISTSPFEGASAIGYTKHTVQYRCRRRSDVLEIGQFFAQTATAIRVNAGAASGSFTRSYPSGTMEQMRQPRIDASLADWLYREAKADRWRLSQTAFVGALEASCAKTFQDRDPADRERSRYLATLHLEDLALACACAEGD